VKSDRSHGRVWCVELRVQENPWQMIGTKQRTRKVVKRSCEDLRSSSYLNRRLPRIQQIEEDAGCAVPVLLQLSGAMGHGAEHVRSRRECHWTSLKNGWSMRSLTLVLPIRCSLLVSRLLIWSNQRLQKHWRESTHRQRRSRNSAEIRIKLLKRRLCCKAVVTTRRHRQGARDVHDDP
jgi:hypothetical protein